LTAGFKVNNKKVEIDELIAQLNEMYSGPKTASHFLS